MTTPAEPKAASLHPNRHPNRHHNLGFDPEALRAKYRIERDKRLRADGNEQYQEVKGDFSRYIDDPYVAPGFERPPLTDEVEVVVIGGGYGGLLAGARLREAGVQSIRMIEKGCPMCGSGRRCTRRFRPSPTCMAWTARPSGVCCS